MRRVSPECEARVREADALAGVRVMDAPVRVADAPLRVFGAPMRV